jgi:hypothetical protein
MAAEWTAELSHHDRAVAVGDRGAVDLQMQTVAAADLQIDERAVGALTAYSSTCAR